GGRRLASSLCGSRRLVSRGRLRRGRDRWGRDRWGRDRCRGGQRVSVWGCVWLLPLPAMLLKLLGGHLWASGKSRHRSKNVNQRLAVLFIVGVAAILSAASAYAGPCTTQIAQFEEAVHQSANDPGAGPMAPQSIGAQLDRQPTPGSVKRAEKR